MISRIVAVFPLCAAVTPTTRRYRLSLKERENAVIYGVRLGSLGPGQPVSGP
jgi:hypothetical protein